MTDEIRRVVNAALRALPAEFRSAVSLRELDGMAYADIAEMMNTPVGTVRSRIYRARELIDLHLRQVFDNGLGRQGERRAVTARKSIGHGNDASRPRAAESAGRL